jgi:beta-N-acetylhexosaminidase
MKSFLLFIIVGLLIILPFKFSAEVNNLESLSDKELLDKIDQLFIVGFRGHTYANSPDIKIILERTNLGGVILFDYDTPTKKYSRNIRTSTELRKLTSDLQKNSKTPLFVSVDEEGGSVSRLKALSDFRKTSSALYLGSQSDSVVKATAIRLGLSLKKYGINFNFAPVVDVNVNRLNPVISRYGRAFSGDPTVVSKKGIAFSQGLMNSGIIPSIKHYPGHGSSDKDTHIGFANITNTYKEYETKPFEDACKVGVPTVMVGHLINENVDSDHPATLSSAHIDNLKRKIGCKDQLIVSDDLDMGAVMDNFSRKEALTKAINAGIDVIIISNNIKRYDPASFFEARQIVLDQVKNGEIEASRINEAYEKIIKIKKDFKIIKN